MSTDGEKIDVHGVHIHRDLANCLSRICVEEDLTLTTNLTCNNHTVMLYSYTIEVKVNVKVVIYSPQYSAQKNSIYIMCNAMLFFQRFEVFN